MSVGNTEDAPINRGVESVWWAVQFKDVRHVKRSSTNYHAVADCSNLVILFCILLASRTNPQKGRNMFVLGSLVVKMNSTVHHMLNFVFKLLRDTSKQRITVI